MPTGVQSLLSGSYERQLILPVTSHSCSLLDSIGATLLTLIAAPKIYRSLPLTQHNPAPDAISFRTDNSRMTAPPNFNRQGFHARAHNYRYVARYQHHVKYKARC